MLYRMWIIDIIYALLKSCSILCIIMSFLVFDKDLKKELARKLLHLIFFLVVPLMKVLSNREIEGILVVGGILYYVVEALRMRGVPIFILSKIQSCMLRKQEQTKISYAPLTLILGIILSMELYVQPAAIAAIIAVTIGDVFSTIVGKIIPKWRVFWNKNKTISGTIANGLAVGFVIVFFFDIRTAYIVGIASALIESLELEEVDNLMVPLFVGTIMYLFVL